MYLFFFIDYRRNVIKADLGLVKKGQFPMALVENARRFVHFNICKKRILIFMLRKMTARPNKFSGFFASNSLSNSGTTNGSHNPIITFQDPSTESYFK